jgi:hypothetical protein
VGIQQISPQAIYRWDIHGVRGRPVYDFVETKRISADPVGIQQITPQAIYRHFFLFIASKSLDKLRAIYVLNWGLESLYKAVC